ncbi:MAG: hypothetical protein WC375_07795 [Methanomassiliicoccales archaeon]
MMEKTYSSELEAINQAKANLIALALADLDSRKELFVSQFHPSTFGVDRNDGETQNQYVERKYKEILGMWLREGRL